MAFRDRDGVQHTAGVAMETQLDRHCNETLHGRSLTDLLRTMMAFAETRGFDWEIGRKLNPSQRDVTWRRQQLMGKSGCGTKCGAVLRAVKLGLIEGL